MNPSNGDNTPRDDETGNEWDDIRADGGEGLDSEIFTRKSDLPDVSRYDRFKQRLNSYLVKPLWAIKNDLRAAVGLLIIIFFVLVGTVGVRVLSEPRPVQGDIYESPGTSLELLFGTDLLGQSILHMVVHATPAMLKMVLAGAVLSAGLGTLIGTVAGYKGGLIDKVMMTITDTVLCIPGIILVIVIAAIYPPENPYFVGLLLGIDAWPGLARTLRSQVLSIREEAYTEMSRVLGLSQWTIFRKDVITNMAPYILINFANSARGIIFQSVALYFLAILPHSTLNWGVMLNQAYQTSDLTNLGQIHWLLMPMFTIVFFSLGLILFSQGMDRVFNVRLQARADSEESEAIEDDPDEQAETSRV